MLKGLGTGMLSGSAVGVIVMSGLSLYSPLPQDRIDAAPKLQTTVAEPDTAATPEATAAIAAEKNAPTVASAEDAESVSPSTPEATAASSDTTTSAQTVEAPVVSGEVSEEASVAATENTAPVATAQTASNAASETVTAQQPTQTASTEASPSVEAELDTSPVAKTDAPVTALGAETDSATVVQPSEPASTRIVGEEQIEAETPEPVQTATLAAPKKPSLPIITTPKPATEAALASADTPIVLPTPEVPGVVTNRLPSVGGLTQTAPEPAAAPSAVEVAPEVAEPLGALEQFASAAEVAEGKSLLSFVLIDSGEDGVPRKDIIALAVPVTIAIDPVAENAASIMAEYRAAGIEVVAIANDLPVSAGPGDVATAVSAYFDVLSQSVALMDPLDARIQSNRSLLQPILGAIRDTGHGLITYDRGLNTAQQAAKRESIPAATVFRVLDADLESMPKIKRYLDRAAFAANQDGAVVVVGRSYPDTVQAMVEWSLEKKDASIAVVPVSAVMLAGGGS